MQAAGEQGARLCNRAMRRRKGRLQQGIVQSLAEGPGAPGEKRKARMLETHVWHAKRMRMTTRCSSALQQGLTYSPGLPSIVRIS